MRTVVMVVLVLGRGAAALVVGQCPWSWTGGFQSPGMADFPISASVRALAAIDDRSGQRLWVGGRFSLAGTTAVHYLGVWNGHSWSRLSAELDGDVYAMVAFDDGTGPGVYAGGDFGVAGGVPVGYVAKWDGANWSALGLGAGAEVNALVVFGDGSGPALYCGTSKGQGPAVSYVKKWDGVAWTALGSGMTVYDFYPKVLALAVYDAGSGSALYAAGHFSVAGGVGADNIAKWNGSAWEPVGGGVLGGSHYDVSALAVFDDGSGPALYAGGEFTWAGDVEALRIARWDGQRWSAVGGGVSGWWQEVYALTAYDDGTGPALYVGGAFTAAGGTSARNIAKWDGASWSALGTGVNGAVRALGVYQAPGANRPALYVGGEFVAAGGIGVSRIARWDGTGWSALTTGNGMGFSLLGVEALTTFEPAGSTEGRALYAAGAFQAAGPIEANSIARWDGLHWYPLGSGADGIIGALKAYEPPDDPQGAVLYAAGRFSYIGGILANCVGRWDGTTWSALGAGLRPPGVVMHAVEVFDSGDGPSVYVAGENIYLDGLSHRVGVARWDGQAWSAPGYGLPAKVFALAVYDDGRGAALYAGGVFKTYEGESGLDYLARWDGITWSPVGDLNADDGDPWVFALLAFDDGSGPALYVGGAATSAGGIPIHGVARWDGASWSAVGAELEIVTALAAFDEDGDGPGRPVLYASAENGLARWDGVRWSIVDDVANVCLAPFDDGTGPALYAGGEFVTVGDVVSVGIAKWSRQCPAGDMNCDGIVNLQDVEHFIQALFDRAGYIADHNGSVYPPCDIRDGDFTADGVVNNQDIDGFVGKVLGEL